MTSEDELPALSIEDTKLIIAKLGDLTNEIVLIGGQAAGFWAGYYGVEADQPLTSKDIDFCGNIAAVGECAKRLGGKARLAGMDRATPVLGVVYYVDREQHERKIDFLGHAFGAGLDYDKIRELAIVVDLDETCTFRVMHPLHNLESRTHNVAGLPDQYNNPLGLAQLRASIVCARAFLRTLLDNEEPSGIRHVLNLNTRIFKFAAYDTHALAVYRDHGIDVFDALFLDERLPEKFRDDGYPRWVQRLEKQRG
jgi:hypothetical protein